MEFLLRGLDGQMDYCGVAGLDLVGFEGRGVGKELAQVEDL